MWPGVGAVRGVFGAVDGPGKVTTAGTRLVPSPPALTSCSCRPKFAGAEPDLPLHPPPPPRLLPCSSSGLFVTSLGTRWRVRVMPVPPAASAQPGTRSTLGCRWVRGVGHRPRATSWGHQRSGLCPFPCGGSREGGDSPTPASLCPSPSRGLLGPAGGGTVPSAQQVAPVPHQWPPSLPSTGQSRARCWVPSLCPGSAPMAALSPLSPGCQVPPAVLPRGAGRWLWFGGHCGGDMGGQGHRAAGRGCSRSREHPEVSPCPGGTWRCHPARSVPMSKGKP